MRLESVRKRGYHVSTNGMGTGMLTWPADDGILLLSTIADDPKPEQVRDLAGSGPQLACERWKEGSPGALDAGRRHRGFDFVQVRPGNVDLPRTMLAQFRWNTDAVKTSLNHEGRSLTSNNLMIK